jgi:hypothetical protein
MVTNNESRIRAYKFLFPGEKEYVWESLGNRDFIKFKVSGLYDSFDKIRVYVELIDYRYSDVSKKLVGEGTMNIMRYRMSHPLESDFNLCSINNFDVLVINESKFLLPEKSKKFQPEFKIYTGRAGFNTLRESSYLFKDDKDDDIMSYMSLLGTNRFR